MQGDYGALAGRLDEIVAEVPGYMAALALRARVAELLDDLPGAFGRYLAIQANHSASALKVIQLRSQAVSTIGQEIKNALSLGHLDGAVERLEQLRSLGYIR